MFRTSYSLTSPRSYLDAYIDAAGIREEKKTPLFRSAAGRSGAGFRLL
jgi:hypothetical protein